MGRSNGAAGAAEEHREGQGIACTLTPTRKERHIRVRSRLGRILAEMSGENRYQNTCTLWMNA
jgi:hypothetical protein